MELARAIVGLIAVVVLSIAAVKLWISVGQREQELADEIALLREWKLLRDEVVELRARVATLEKLLPAEDCQ